MTTLPGSVEQQRYQVRFDWGVDGAARIAPDADAIVWVDAIGDLDCPVGSLPTGCAMLVARLADAAEVARQLFDLQRLLGRRALLAVVAAGAPRGDGIRFAVEDLLAAGAIVDALGSLGIDATSPEAAVAEAAYSGLRGAVGHLFSASVTATNGADPLVDVGASSLAVLRSHPLL